MALDGIAERLACQAGELRSFGVADIVNRLVESIWQEAHAAALSKEPQPATTPRGSWEGDEERATPVMHYPWDKSSR